MLYLIQALDELEKMSVKPAVLPSGSHSTVLKKRSSTPVVARKSTVSITPSEVSVESYMESLSQEVNLYNRYIKYRYHHLFVNLTGYQSKSYHYYQLPFWQQEVPLITQVFTEVSFAAQSNGKYNLYDFLPL